MYDFESSKSFNIFDMESGSNEPELKFDGYLMLKDKQLLYCNGGEVRVNEKYFSALPLDLRGIYKQLMPRQVSDFLSSRVLDIGRVNAKYICNSLHLPQDEKLTVALYCDGLSLTDCYWFKQKDSEQKWADVNLYHNKLSDAVAEIAFTGRSDLTIQNNMVTPELTGGGSFAKCWVREPDNNIYLYKADSDIMPGAANEFISTKVLDILNIAHVDYNIINYRGRVTSRCKLITSEDFSIFTYRSFEKFYNNQELNRYAIDLVRKYQEYWQMILFDGLISNTDRHKGNWGFQMSTDTGEVIGLHPLFDHNITLEYRAGEVESLYEENLTLLEAGKKAYNLLGKPKEVFEVWEWLQKPNTINLFKDLYGHNDIRRKFVKERCEYILK